MQKIDSSEYQNRADSIEHLINGEPLASVRHKLIRCRAAWQRLADGARSREVEEAASMALLNQPRSE